MSETFSFCEQCGAPLERGVRFCEECGHAVDAPGSARLTIPVPLQWGALIGGVAAIGVVAVVVALIVSGTFDGDDGTPVLGRDTESVVATPTVALAAQPSPTEQRPPTASPLAPVVVGTAQETVYAAFGYGPSTPIINCNSGEAGANKPCWDTPTYQSVSESGDLVYLFRPQFDEWYWVLVKEGSDGSFDVADIVLAEGEFELFNSPFAAAREFDTPEEAIGVRLVEIGIQPPAGDCNDPTLEPGAFCVCPHTLVDEFTVLYLVGQTFSEFFDALLVEQLLDGSFAADFSSLDFETNVSCLDSAVRLPWDN